MVYKFFHPIIRKQVHHKRYSLIPAVTLYFLTNYCLIPPINPHQFLCCQIFRDRLMYERYCSIAVRNYNSLINQPVYDLLFLSHFLGHMLCIHSFIYKSGRKGLNAGIQRPVSRYRQSFSDFCPFPKSIRKILLQVPKKLPVKMLRL